MIYIVIIVIELILLLKYNNNNNGLSVKWKGSVEGDRWFFKYSGLSTLTIVNCSLDMMDDTKRSNSYDSWFRFYLSSGR